jgi:hypothetical protein
VDSTGKTFQVGLKEEKGIIGQVQWDKFAKEAIETYRIVSFLNIKEDNACVSLKTKAIGDEIGDSRKFRDFWLFTVAKLFRRHSVILMNKRIQCVGYSSIYKKLL